MDRQTKNAIARAVMYWTYENLDERTPERLGYADWWEMYEVSQREDFKDYPAFTNEDGALEELVLCNDQPMKLKYRLSYMYDYAKLAVEEVQSANKQVAMDFMYKLAFYNMGSCVGEPKDYGFRNYQDMYEYLLDNYRDYGHAGKESFWEAVERSNEVEFFVGDLIAVKDIVETTLIHLSKQDEVVVERILRGLSL